MKASWAAPSFYAGRPMKEGMKMLYPDREKTYSEEMFRSPKSEYRATPFWAWNSPLEEEDLLWQIEQLKKMGFGGFHMHVRTGLDIEYLGKEYMGLIKSCVEKAKQEEMLAYLYDEDRWPSGAAGGFVTRQPQYRIRHLLLTRHPYGEAKGATAFIGSKAGSSRTENGSLIACYDVSLNPDGSLRSYRRIEENEQAKGFKLYAYDEAALPSPWFNNETYANTLDPAAIREFIRITYERYHEKLSGDFGGVVPSIFTDEPQFSEKETLGFALEDRDVSLPWTSDLPETYRAAYNGEELLEALPELMWDKPEGEISPVRYHYHDHIAERFSSAFADQCGSWCREHGLMLTGHMMEEPTLWSQTRALGEAMRSYRSFQLPGIDMLCDHREFTTAKQAQSAARQYGCPGVLSELYGVTNWDFDFRGHKLQGDWQAALGVTVRVPHLSWVSMNGEAKRDYPSTFNYQSPWYREYPYIEDHFARTASVMTRGRAVCRVGVLHPVESYWLHWGPKENTEAIRSQMDRRFQDLCSWLLRGLIDFDYLCESTLPAQCEVPAISGESFPVGEMRYNVVLVPAMETIRSTTLERLEAFQRAGGRILFLGDAPCYVDAHPDERARRLWEKCEQIAFDRNAILQALEPLREIDIRMSDGSRSSSLLYQLREEPGCQWLFIAHADAPENKDLAGGGLLTLRLKGEWACTRYDTLSGETAPEKVLWENGWTLLRTAFYDHDSLLIKMDHSAPQQGQSAPALIPDREGVHFLAPVPVTLEEPNVLLLDMAQASLDGGPLSPCEEILRLDNQLRQKLGWPTRGEAFAQPWVENDSSTPHTLRLCYRFESELPLSGAKLALENAKKAVVSLNGQPAGPCDGWYVDKCIGTRPLPEIKEGENLLEISLPYGRKVDIEACYLLGDFGVSVRGIRSVLTAPVKSLCFGDITRQGLPFYGGNLCYHLKAESHGGPLYIRASCYRGHLLRVRADGKDCGVIAFSPYTLKIEGLAPGEHDIELVYFGSRVNTFGQLHRNDHLQPWWGPNSWRSTGDSWTYEYRFWKQGVLKSPEIWEE